MKRLRVTLLICAALVILGLWIATSSPPTLTEKATTHEEAISASTQVAETTITEDAITNSQFTQRSSSGQESIIADSSQTASKDIAARQLTLSDQGTPPITIGQSPTLTAVLQQKAIANNKKITMTGRVALNSQEVAQIVRQIASTKSILDEQRRAESGRVALNPFQRRLISARILV